MLSETATPVLPIRNIKVEDPVFSILIPSWNNLDYLKLCVASIRKNSSFKHQILVHLNQGTDGSLEWAQQQPDIAYTHSDANLGVCYPLNILANKATTDYILYLNDDMYVCPEWDLALYEEIEKIGHKYFFLSATAIEANMEKACAVHKNFGSCFTEFNEKELLAKYKSLNIPDWQGATWPPNVVHRDIWHMVGGYSIEFSPGMYSDPDFSMKLWQAGVRYFKGINTSKVYHFGSLSVRRAKRNKGYHQFLNKWGMTSSTVTRYILRRGEPYSASKVQRKIPRHVKLKNYVRRLVSSLFKTYETY